MTITALPSPPSTNDPANFATKADALLAALPAFVTEANATAAAMNLNSTTDTSASSVAISTGAKSFTVSIGKSFQPGMWLVIADTAAPSTNQMIGTVTSYDLATGALLMNITAILGSGTKTAWVVSQSSSGGAIAGPLATSGITGAAASGANSDITSLSAAAASQAEQEAAISLIKFVSPGRQHMHPSADKAWGYISASGTSYTTVAAYGVTSVVRNSIGNLTVTLSTPFSSANFAALVTGADVDRTYTSIPATASTFTVLIRLSATGAQADGGFHFACKGDQ